MKNIFSTFLALTAIAVFTACGDDPTSPGTEYMPDMGHSIAQEANVLTDYYYNTWDEKSTVKLRNLQEHNLPVENTVPRGYAGVYFAMDSTGNSAQTVMSAMNGDGNSIAIPMNGSVPYYYKDTEEERTRATAEIQANPFPITEDGLARGKELYNLFCAICHGEKGDGNGWLVDEANPNAVYPAAPANFLLDEHVNSSNGRYYHAIMYGKNVMGAYKDKINYEERWQVIHWIRALQAKEKKVDYNVDSNTLNPVYGKPGASIKTPIADAAPMTMSDDVESTTGEEQGGSDEHDGEHGDGHSH